MLTAVQRRRVLGAVFLFLYAFNLRPAPMPSMGLRPLSLIPTPAQGLATTARSDRTYSGISASTSSAGRVSDSCRPRQQARDFPQ
jgi:hypothetical protein